MNRADWYTLYSVHGIGRMKFDALIRAFGMEADYFNMEEERLMEEAGLTAKDAAMVRCTDAYRREKEREYEGLSDRGIRMALQWEPEYPRRLNCLADAPPALFYMGELPPEEEPVIAMVGARACTNYGRSQAKEWGRIFAEQGIGIVSGMALGIDGASHAGALQAADGKSYAILGCGVDICYPESNRSLYETLKRRGGVISEFPPGTEALPAHFPRRNRLISGLSDMLLVMEARKKSGSLITVNFALEQGKEVFALPGRTTDPLSVGCLELIRDGAGMLVHPEDILAHFRKKVQTSGTKLTDSRQNHKIILAEPEKQVYSVIDFTPKHVDEIVRESKLLYPECVSCLVSLELKGMIEQVGGQHYALSSG